MSLTTVGSGNVVTRWLRKFWAERVREDWFAPYFGTNQNAIIQVKEELTTQAGKTISIPIITRLKGSGVRGNTTLEGSEEELGNANHDVSVFTLRNGVKVTKNEQQKTEIDFMNAARPRLKDWILEEDRDDMITAIMSMGADKALLTAQVKAESNYTTLADETAKDAYLAANSDRFLFGAAISNNSSNDHSASLANIDDTTDKLDAGIISLAKRIAQTADPHIRPIMTKQGEEWFVMFCSSLSMRDLRADSTITQANREAWQRWERMKMDGGTNPIFRGGDILYDGVICREIPEMPSVGLVGASSIAVAGNYLCGAQALCKAWARRSNIVVETRDYKFKKGVAIDEMRGISKVIYTHPTSGLVIQHGVVTVYTAGVADS